MYKLLSERAISNPDDLALASSRQAQSFKQLLGVVDAVSSRLSKAGVDKGQLVAINLPSFDNWIVTLALAKIGAVSLSLSPRKNSGPPDSEPWHYLVTSDFGGVPDKRTLVVDGSWANVDQGLCPVSPAELNEKSLVRAIYTCLLYTSDAADE